MTAARQQRKQRKQRKQRNQCTVLAAVLGLGLAAGILTPSAASAATDDRTVVNVNTGLAISGFDPVAYFTDNKPTSGRTDLELSQSGVVWRFSNEGNRAEFAAHPDVYTPRFGGYDPVAVARGTSVPGHPMFWAVVTGRLYLFYSAAAREAFITDPGLIIETAERKWPEVARTIGR